MVQKLEPKVDCPLQPREKPRLFFEGNTPLHSCTLCPNYRGINDDHEVICVVDGDEPGEEDPFSEGTKVELLKMVMTGKIKREDYLKSIKED